MPAVIETSLRDVLIVEPEAYEDDRGLFFESWNAASFAAVTGSDAVFVQDNHSRSRRGVLRGLHYQVPPHEQGKLVRAVRGSVFDVAVDIRRSSPDFGKWTGVELSARNRRQVWVPSGYAHGFQALSDTADVLYKTTAYYAPTSDRSIRWDDPAIGIDWPLASDPILSEKDARAPLLADADVFD